MIALLENRKIRNVIRIIAITLIVSFIAYDIAWAYPDGFSARFSQNNKLAPQTLLNDKEFRLYADAKYLEALIEAKNAQLGGTLRLDTLRNLLEEWKEEAWFKRSLEYPDKGYKGKDEVLITVSPGYTLRYYEPKIVDDVDVNQDRYGNHIKDTRRVSNYLNKQLLIVKELPTQVLPEEGIQGRVLSLGIAALAGVALHLLYLYIMPAVHIAEPTLQALWPNTGISALTWVGAGLTLAAFVRGRKFVFVDVRRPSLSRKQLRLTLWEFVEREAIREALIRTDGNKPRASKMLRIHRATLYRRINRYGIEIPSEEPGRLFKGLKDKQLNLPRLRLNLMRKTVKAIGNVTTAAKVSGIGRFVFYRYNYGSVPIPAEVSKALESERLIPWARQTKLIRSWLGLNESYYRILGVPFYASQEEIHQAYRLLAKEHHPDRGGDSEEFKKISSAYKVLSNSIRRAEYDSLFLTKVPKDYINHCISTLESLQGGIALDTTGGKRIIMLSDEEVADILGCPVVLLPAVLKKVNETLAKERLNPFEFAAKKSLKKGGFSKDQVGQATAGTALRLGIAALASIGASGASPWTEFGKFNLSILVFIIPLLPFTILMVRMLKWISDYWRRRWPPNDERGILKVVMQMRYGNEKEHRVALEIFRNACELHGNAISEAILKELIQAGRFFYHYGEGFHKELEEIFIKACNANKKAVTEKVILELITYLYGKSDHSPEYSLLVKLLQTACNANKEAITDAILESQIKEIEERKAFMSRIRRLKILDLLIPLRRDFITESILIRLLNLFRSYPYESIEKHSLLNTFKVACDANRNAVTENVLRKNVDLVMMLFKNEEKIDWLDLRRACMAFAKTASLACHKLVNMYKREQDRDLPELLRKADDLMARYEYRLRNLSPGAQQLVKIRFLLHLKGTIEESPNKIIRGIRDAERPYRDFDNTHIIGQEVHLPYYINDENAILMLGLFSYLNIVPGNLDEEGKPKITATFESPSPKKMVLEFQTLPSNSYQVQHRLMEDVKKMGEALGLDFIPSKARADRLAPLEDVTLVGHERHLSISGELLNRTNYVQIASLALNAQLVHEVLKRYTGDKYKSLAESLVPGEGHIGIREPRDSALGGMRTEFLDIAYFATNVESLAGLFSNFNSADLRTKYLLSLGLKKSLMETPATPSDSEIAMRFNEFCKRIDVIFARSKLRSNDSPEQILQALLKNPDLTEEIFSATKEYLDSVEAIIMEAKEPGLGRDERGVYLGMGIGGIQGLDTKWIVVSIIAGIALSLGLPYIIPWLASIGASGALPWEKIGKFSLFLIAILPLLASSMEYPRKDNLPTQDLRPTIKHRKLKELPEDSLAKLFAMEEEAFEGTGLGPTEIPQEDRVNRGTECIVAMNRDMRPEGGLFFVRIKGGLPRTRTKLIKAHNPEGKTIVCYSACRATLTTIPNVASILFGHVLSHRQLRGIERLLTNIDERHNFNSRLFKHLLSRRRLMRIKRILTYTPIKLPTIDAVITYLEECLRLGKPPSKEYLKANQKALGAVYYHLTQGAVIREIIEGAIPGGAAAIMQYWPELKDADLLGHYSKLLKKLQKEKISVSDRREWTTVSGALAVAIIVVTAALFIAVIRLILPILQLHLFYMQNFAFLDSNSAALLGMGLVAIPLSFGSIRDFAPGLRIIHSTHLTEGQVDMLAEFLVRENIAISTKYIDDQRHAIEVGREYIDKITERKEAQENGFLVAFRNGEVAGFISYSIYHSKIAEYDATLNDMYITPQYRDSGIGTSLVKEAIDYLRSQDAKSYCITVAPEKYAQDFWGRMIPPQFQIRDKKGVFYQAIVRLNDGDVSPKPEVSTEKLDSTGWGQIGLPGLVGMIPTANSQQELERLIGLFAAEMANVKELTPTKVAGALVDFMIDNPLQAEKVCVVAYGLEGQGVWRIFKDDIIEFAGGKIEVLPGNRFKIALPRVEPPPSLTSKGTIPQRTESIPLPTQKSNESAARAEIPKVFADIGDPAAIINYFFPDLGIKKIEEIGRILKRSSGKSYDDNSYGAISKHFSLAEILGCISDFVAYILANYRTKFLGGKLVFLGGSCDYMYVMAKILAPRFGINPEDVILIDMPESLYKSESAENHYAYLMSKGLFKDNRPIVFIDNGWYGTIPSGLKDVIAKMHADPIKVDGYMMSVADNKAHLISAWSLEMQFPEDFSVSKAYWGSTFLESSRRFSMGLLEHYSFDERGKIYLDYPLKESETINIAWALLVKVIKTAQGYSGKEGEERGGSAAAPAPKPEVDDTTLSGMMMPDDVVQGVVHAVKVGDVELLVIRLRHNPNALSPDVLAEIRSRLTDTENKILNDAIEVVRGKRAAPQDETARVSLSGMAPVRELKVSYHVSSLDFFPSIIEMGYFTKASDLEFFIAEKARRRLLKRYSSEQTELYVQREIQRLREGGLRDIHNYFWITDSLKKAIGRARHKLKRRILWNTANDLFGRYGESKRPIIYVFGDDLTRDVQFEGEGVARHRALLRKLRNLIAPIYKLTSSTVDIRYVSIIVVDNEDVERIGNFLKEHNIHWIKVIGIDGLATIETLDLHDIENKIFQTLVGDTSGGKEVIGAKPSSASEQVKFTILKYINYRIKAIFIRLVCWFLSIEYRRHVIGEVWHNTTKGIFVPSVYSDVTKMFRAVNLGKGMKSVDLGSGLGDVVFLAAAMGADSKGIEFDEELYNDSLGALRILKRIGLFKSANIGFENNDYLKEKINLSEYDVLYWYHNEREWIGESDNAEQLQEKIRATKFKPGTKLIVYGGHLWEGFNLWKKSEGDTFVHYHIYIADANGSFVSKSASPQGAEPQSISAPKPDVSKRDTHPTLLTSRTSLLDSPVLKLLFYYSEKLPWAGKKIARARRILDLLLLHMAEKNRKAYIGLFSAFVIIEVIANAIKLIAYIYSAYSIFHGNVVGIGLGIATSTFFGGITREAVLLLFKPFYWRTSFVMLFVTAWIPFYIGFGISVPFQILYSSRTVASLHRTHPRSLEFFILRWLHHTKTAVADMFNTYRKANLIRAMMTNKIEKSLRYSDFTRGDRSNLEETSAEMVDAILRYQTRHPEVGRFKIRSASAKHANIAKLAREERPVLLIDTKEACLRVPAEIEKQCKLEVQPGKLYYIDPDFFLNPKNIYDPDTDYIHPILMDISKSTIPEGATPQGSEAKAVPAPTPDAFQIFASLGIREEAWESAKKIADLRKMLIQLVEQAEKDGKPRFVCIDGDAGVGKTTFCKILKKAGPAERREILHVEADLLEDEYEKEGVPMGEEESYFQSVKLPEYRDSGAKLVLIDQVNSYTLVSEQERALVVQIVTSDATRNRNLTKRDKSSLRFNIRTSVTNPDIVIDLSRDKRPTTKEIELLLKYDVEQLQEKSRRPSWRTRLRRYFKPRGGFVDFGAQRESAVNYETMLIKKAEEIEERLRKAVNKVNNRVSLKTDKDAPVECYINTMGELISDYGNLPIAIYPKRKEVINHPELKVLESCGANFILVPGGSFGEVVVKVIFVDGKPCLLINEVQPSYGYRRLVGEDREYIRRYCRWNKTLVEHIVKLARSMGIENVYASTPERTKKNIDETHFKLRGIEIDVTVTDQQLKHNYHDPFVRDWRPVDISFAYLGMSIKDKTILEEQDTLWHYSGAIPEGATTEAGIENVSAPSLFGPRSLGAADTGPIRSNAAEVIKGLKREEARNAVVQLENMLDAHGRVIIDYGALDLPSDLNIKSAVSANLEQISVVDFEYRDSSYSHIYAIYKGTQIIGYGTYVLNTDYTKISNFRFAILEARGEGNAYVALKLILSMCYERYAHRGEGLISLRMPRFGNLQGPIREDAWETQAPVFFVRAGFEPVDVQEADVKEQIKRLRRGELNEDERKALNEVIFDSNLVYETGDVSKRDTQDDKVRAVHADNALPQAETKPAEAFLGSVEDTIRKRFGERDEIFAADLDTGQGQFVISFGDFLKNIFRRVRMFGVETKILSEITGPSQALRIREEAEEKGYRIIDARSPREKGDYEGTELYARKWDIITINNIVMKRRQALFDHAEKILAPQGLLFVSIEKHDYDEGHNDTVREDLEKRGFEVREIAPVPSDYPYVPYTSVAREPEYESKALLVCWRRDSQNGTSPVLVSPDKDGDMSKRDTPENADKPLALQEFIEQHTLPYRTVGDGAMYMPTPFSAIVDSFNILKKFYGELEGKCLLDVGTGDLRMSLVALNLFGVEKSIAVEKDPNISSKTEACLIDALDKGFASPKNLVLHSNTDALDMNWDDIDIGIFYYTEPDSKQEAKRFRERLQEKIVSMKAGSVFVMLFTAGQLGRKKDEFTGLKALSPNPVEVFSGLGGIYFQVYRAQTAPAAAAAEKVEGVSPKGTSLTATINETEISTVLKGMGKGGVRDAAHLSKIMPAISAENAPAILEELVRRGFIEQEHIPTSINNGTPKAWRSAWFITTHGREWLVQQSATPRAGAEPAAKHPNLVAITELVKEGAATRPISKGGRILVDETLLSPEDAKHLREFLGENSPITISSPEEIRNASLNQKASRENLACIVNKTSYDDPLLWGSNHRSQNKAALVILGDDLAGEKYLYLEGIIGLARELMRENKDEIDRARVNKYLSLLFDKTQDITDDKLLELLLNEPRKFADFIKLKTIQPFDTEELSRQSKIDMETRISA